MAYSLEELIPKLQEYLNKVYGEGIFKVRLTDKHKLKLFQHSPEIGHVATYQLSHHDLCIEKSREYNNHKHPVGFVSGLCYALSVFYRRHMTSDPMYFEYQPLGWLRREGYDVMGIKKEDELIPKPYKIDLYVGDIPSKIWNFLVSQGLILRDDYSTYIYLADISKLEADMLKAPDNYEIPLSQAEEYFSKIRASRGNYYTYDNFVILIHYL